MASSFRKSKLDSVCGLRFAIPNPLYGRPRTGRDASFFVAAHWIPATLSPRKRGAGATLEARVAGDPKSGLLFRRRWERDVRRRWLLVRRHVCRRGVTSWAEVADVAVDRAQVLRAHRADVRPGHRRPRFQRFGLRHPLRFGQRLHVLPRIDAIRRPPRPAPAEFIAHQPIFLGNVAVGGEIAGSVAVVAAADGDQVLAAGERARVRLRTRRLRGLSRMYRQGQRARENDGDQSTRKIKSHSCLLKITDRNPAGTRSLPGDGPRTIHRKDATPSAA